jgi:hypothetical protein
MYTGYEEFLEYFGEDWEKADWPVGLDIFCRFPGFSIVTIWDTFHCPGKYPVRRMLLKTYVIAEIPTCGNCL